MLGKAAEEGESRLRDVEIEGEERVVSRGFSNMHIPSNT